MDCDEEENHATAPAESGNVAVNSLILDYYKKFGRKRDLEQYFSLSTAQNDLKDSSGSFWQKMKSENDSSDSGGKKSDSSQELCRISIRCSLPDPCSSQYHIKPKPILTGGALLDSLGIHVKALEEDSKTKSESASPPIIVEEVPQDVTQNSEDESVKSYGNNSQKSFDILDSSTNKPLSPSSSITSQRKLEWDSLADVGYANESDRKTSASSLSTLERLALKQQYSNNDTKLDSVLEPPTAHSTPLDENEGKTKGKKGVGKKSTKIYKKDVEYLEVNVPHSSENNAPQTINVNLTKHISFNVEKDGKVSVDNIQKDVSVSPEKVTETASPRIKLDKEMQTSLNKTKDHAPKTVPQKIPVLISLNTLRRQNRRKKLRMARRKLRSKKKNDKENLPVQEKSGDQVSEAESFEYMPGHMYNQNQRSVNEQSGNTAGNKSSLESSGLLTTDSSKGSKHSFTKDLEKSIDILRAALQKGSDDTNLRKQLIKQVCERLLKSKYRDDESTSDFLSGLSFSSRKLGLGARNHTSTSTSDNSGENRPKKSILRNDKFNSAAIASTSQSAPNLPVATNSEKPVTSNLMKNLTSNTDSDLSNKEKSSSDNVFAKTTSQELYQKYLEALKREENYKRHLKDKEMFLKQKLVCSDSAIKVPARTDAKVNSRLKDLIKDLTRNNYDDGSGDASKLEGGPNSSRDHDRLVPPRSQRSHSVFTLSSGNSDQSKQNVKKRLKCDLNISKPGTSKEHYCCCPHHSPKSKVRAIDSSVQVNIKSCNNPTCEHNLSPRGRCSPRERSGEKNESPRSLAKVVADDSTGDIKYVCLCNNKTIQDVPDNFMIFKCSRMAKGNDDGSSNSSCRSRNLSPRKNQEMPKPAAVPCTNCTKNDSSQNICGMKTTTKSSQTNFLLKMLQQRSEDSQPSSCGSKKSSHGECSGNMPLVPSKIYEATRWLQTEISINPRIPEPSLSDILIVTDCANMVSEQCRVVTKPSLTDVFSSKQTIETYNSGSCKSSGTSKGIGELFEADTSVKAQCSTTINNNRGSGSDCSEKYTIPLQGTNMTLMVSIGSNERKKPEDMIGECIGTEKRKMTEQGTSLAEECSKGVQYDAGLLAMTDHNCNIANTIVKPNNPIVNTCLTTEDPTFNTYPKTSPVNQQKPFRRANTDTNNFDKCTVPSDHCFKPPQKPLDSNKCNTQPICKKDLIEKETQCSKPNSPRCSCQCKIKDCDNKCHKQQGCMTVDNVKKFESSFCCCGCGGDKAKCKKDCVGRKKSVSTQCQCGCGDKDMCNKNCDERKKSVSSQCSCGYCGDKEKCNKDCDERKKSISSQCSCGCCGDKDKCNKNCDERKKSVSSQCSCGCCGDKEKCNKDCDERKKSISSQCSCGCCGDKDKCNKNCDERKKSVSSQCSCGCSGDKDKCNKNCDERKKSVSSQCSCGCCGDKDKCNKNCDERKKSISSQCSCGCCGDKDKCNKNCDERNKSVATQCSCGCSSDKVECNKNCDERKSSISTQCSCGCCGDRDKCNKKCEEIKKCLPKENPPTCSCNCGGDIKDCKKNCKDRKKSEATRCLCGCSGDKAKCTKICKEKSSKEIGIQKDSSSCEPTPREKNKSSKDCNIDSIICTPTSKESTSKCTESSSNTPTPRENDRKTKDCNTEVTFSEPKPKEKICKPKIQDCVTESSTSTPTPKDKNPKAKCKDNNVGNKKQNECNNPSTSKEICEVERKPSNCQISESETDKECDPILEMIKNITKKYSKTDCEKPKRRKCFKEIMTVLNYLLETDDSTDCVTTDHGITTESSTTPVCQKPEKKTPKKPEKSGQKNPKPCITESSDCPQSTDIPATSSDSATCKVLNKIKKECERYHQKRCKGYTGNKCSISSSTSANCEQCRRVHHCACRNHKCKVHKKCEKQKKAVAYNLILQAAESISEETVCNNKRPLKTVVVEVPKKKDCSNVPFQEMCEKIKKKMPCSPRKPCRSQSAPCESEISSMEEFLKSQACCTVREYLERNRPDFIAKCSQRQDCLKIVSDSRANLRSAQRDLLSVRLAQLSDVNELNADEVRCLAAELGRYMRQKRPAPKFISEREMKKHSENIYKSLPEVVRKKEEAKKEDVRKTNLLMAHIFRKNLQKKTLSGSVDISNYSPIIKI